MFTNTLSKNAQNALAVLGKNVCLPEKTYLAGGSALALHFGHRISVDFDFFTPFHFQSKIIANKLKTLGSFSVDLSNKDTLLGTFEKVRFSLFLYNYPLLFPPIQFKGIDIADPKEIAAMKIAAITDRGTKKDFIDLFFIIQKGITLEKVFNFYDKKYKVLINNMYTIITSLSYFEDAKSSEMPVMLEKISWPEIETFFIAESVKLAKKYL